MLDILGLALVEHIGALERPGSSGSHRQVAGVELEDRGELVGDHLEDLAKRAIARQARLTV
ncbi:MAG: hypothetical protein U0Z44_17015 [Kouleothrix sp.]